MCMVHSFGRYLFGESHFKVIKASVIRRTLTSTVYSSVGRLHFLPEITLWGKRDWNKVRYGDEDPVRFSILHLFIIERVILSVKIIAKKRQRKFVDKPNDEK